MHQKPPINRTVPLLSQVCKVLQIVHTALCDRVARPWDGWNTNLQEKKEKKKRKPLLPTLQKTRLGGGGKKKSKRK